MLLALLLAQSLAADAGPGPAFLQLTQEERRALPREEAARLIREASIDDLIAIARANVERLGVYSARMTMQERVSDELLPRHTVEAVVRSKPLAAILRYIEGPAKGRTVFFDETVRKTELRARESGFKGIVGALWLSIHGGLAMGDTNHPITDLGFARLVEFFSADVEGAKPFGGITRTDEGLKPEGYCLRAVAPREAKGLRADDTRVCFDVALGLPTWIEVKKGGLVLERFTYVNVLTNLQGDAARITLETAGL